MSLLNQDGFISIHFLKPRMTEFLKNLSMIHRVKPIENSIRMPIKSLNETVIVAVYSN